MSNSAASDVHLALFDLHIVRAMQSSGRRGTTAERVALRKRARRCVRRSGAAKAIMRPAPARRDRCDSDVAIGIVSLATVGREKHSSAAALTRTPCSAAPGV